MSDLLPPDLFRLVEIDRLSELGANVVKIRLKDVSIDSEVPIEINKETGQQIKPSKFTPKRKKKPIKVDTTKDAVMNK